jgi:hypothetical protein
MTSHKSQILERLGDVIEKVRQGPVSKMIDK